MPSIAAPGLHFHWIITSYDSAQRMSQLTSPFGKTCYWTYDTASDTTKKVYGTGVVSTATYDPANRISSLRYAKNDGTPVVYFDYNRDIVAIGRESDLSIYYSYDNVDRLTAEVWRKSSTNAQIYAFTYAYDGAGNRLKMRREFSAGSEWDSSYFSYAVDNSLTKRRTQTPPSTLVDTYYFYDANGSITSFVEGGSATYFTYDTNTLIGGIQPPSSDGSPWAFSYDERLQRTKIDKSGGNFSMPIWDGLNVLDDRDGGGSLLGRYSYGDSPIAGIGNCVELYTPSTSLTNTLAMDHRGTVHAIVDQNGGEVGRRYYDAFGVILGSSGTWPTFFGYQSNWMTVQIGTKWWALSKARLYNFETGIFLTRDPANPTAKLISERRENTWGIYAGTAFVFSIIATALERFNALENSVPINQYQYARNSVIALVDSVGLATKEVTGNNFGDWDINQSSSTHQKPPLNYDYEVSTAIHWKPKGGCCSKIGFLQTLQIVNGAGANQNPIPTYKGRLNSTNWAVDRLPDRSSPFINVTNAGKPEPNKLTYGSFLPGAVPVKAFLWDTPQASLYSVKWSYETCAICLEGVDRGKIYACLKWGFDIDATGKYAAHDSESKDKASSDFGTALLKWNEQANGPAADRNDPNQIPIPLLPELLQAKLQQWQTQGVVPRLP